jgi:hypothetical protein
MPTTSAGQHSVFDWPSVVWIDFHNFFNQSDVSRIQGTAFALTATVIYPLSFFEMVWIAAALPDASA